jgi:hypothetical protein
MTNVTGAALSPALRPLPPSGFNASWDTPTFYRATFSLAAYAPPLRDTFLDMRGWGKGFVVLNGFNLGRFWYLGPEFSLYVPAGALLPGVNELIVFEADGVGAGCSQSRVRGEEWGRAAAEGNTQLAILNTVGGAAVQSRMQARSGDSSGSSRADGSRGFPDARPRDRCPAMLPLRTGSGSPFVTFREVPVRDLPQAASVR